MKWLRQGIGTVLKAGPIPSHVAFIMDGNRRFADRVQAGDRAAGHSKGFLKANLSHVTRQSLTPASSKYCQHSCSME